MDGSGNVFVVDQDNLRIQKFDNTGTFLTKWSIPLAPYAPFGVAVDASGNVFVTGDGAHVQQFDNNGTFITVWGSSGSGNGQFKFPNGVAVDASGNVFVTDPGTDRIQKFFCP